MMQNKVGRPKVKEPKIITKRITVIENELLEFLREKKISTNIILYLSSILYKRNNP